MKTNMLGILMLISVAATAQSTINAKSSASTKVDTKKSQTSVSAQDKASQQSTVKNNKISGKTSLQGGASVNRQPVENPDKKAQPQSIQPVKPKTLETVSATEKEKPALKSSASTTVAEKNAQSAEITKKEIKSGENLSGSTEEKVKAEAKTGEAANASVQKSAKATVASGDKTLSSADSKVKTSQSATVKNANNAKLAVKPHPVKINTQVKSTTAIKIR